jgi:hypothetical protein
MHNQKGRCAVPPDALCTSLDNQGARWNRASDTTRHMPMDGTKEEFHETPKE